MDFLTFLTIVVVCITALFSWALWLYYKNGGD